MQISVTEYLDATAKIFPNKIAFADEREEIAFSELREKSRRIASQLAEKNFFRKPVAVFMEKSVREIVSFLGVAYAGCFYTPIDVDMPAKRVRKILDTLQPAAVITDKTHGEKLNATIPSQIELIAYEDLIADAADLSLVENVAKKIIDTDALYVLFTSGSTGIPKGVVISHRSVIDYVDWATETFRFTSENIFGNQAPLHFDNSVMDIYVALKTGAKTYIIPRRNFAFPIRLMEFIRDKKINTVFWVPSLLVQAANFGVLDDVDISCLHTIIFAGEVMPTKQFNMWRRRLPNATFANLYGPTEIAVDCTYFVVDREFDDAEPLPIGKPCRNTDVLILNEHDELVTGQEQGELCVRGTSLALGYYNAPEKTAAAFVQNPLNPHYPEKIYRTGDLVHYNERGELIFDGRKDFQIKHSGYRIELGEIELAATALNEIKTACCVFDDDADKIFLFYVGGLTEQNLRGRLLELLPSYMVPVAYKKLDELPTNPNGKIDRKRLKELCKGDI